MSNVDSTLIQEALNNVSSKHGYDKVHKLILVAISDRRNDVFGVFDTIESVVDKWFKLRVLNE